MIDRGVDEKIVTEGFATKEKAMDHRFAADEGNGDSFFDPGQTEGGLDEDAIRGVAGGGTNAFPQADVFLKSDEFFILPV